MTTMLKEKRELLNIVKILESDIVQKVKIFIDGMEAGKCINEAAIHRQYGLDNDGYPAQSGAAAQTERAG